MCKNSKLFLFVCMMFLIEIPNSQATGPLTDSNPPEKGAEKVAEKTKGMRSWAPAPQKTEEKEKSPQKTVKDESELSKEERSVNDDIDKLLSEDEEQKNGDDKNLTPEEKLWKKYKDLAKNGKKEKEKEHDEEAETSAEPEKAEKTAEEPEKEKQEKQAAGLRRIIDAYKDSTSSKGKMNSRSFGRGDVD